MANCLFDYAADNEQLKGTVVYWKLNDARFQSRGTVHHFDTLNREPSWFAASAWVALTT